MKLLSLQDALSEFLEQPTAASFVSVRELVVAEEDYRPTADVLVGLMQLVAGGENIEALAFVESLMPAWSLCPRVHFLAGCAADAIGDTDEVELCQFLTTSCLDGIYSTGEGTRESPWMATYPSDIQDVLTSSGKTPQRQRLVRGVGTMLDAVTTAEGPLCWFDVGEMIAAGEVGRTSSSVQAQ